MTTRGPVAVFPSTTTGNNALMLARANDALGTTWSPLVTVEGTSSQKKQATVVQVRESLLGIGDVCALTMPDVVQ